MNTKINVDALQGLVAALAEAVETALEQAPNKCLPCRELALKLGVSDDTIRAFVDLESAAAGEAGELPALETVRKRGVGFNGERSAPRNTGARQKAQKREGRIETLKSLLAAGVPLGDNLLAEIEAYDAEQAASAMPVNLPANIRELLAKMSPQEKEDLFRRVG